MIQGLILAALEVVAVYCPHAQSDPPFRPLVGFLDSTSASDVSTEIALASNAGIGVFLYDGSPGAFADVEKAIDAGFLAADNPQGMKFAVCGRPPVATEDAFVRFVEGVAGRYFVRPEYWRRNGRPVLAVADAADFVRALGSDAARRAIKSVREKVRKTGAGEFELVARGVPNGQVADVRSIGFDSAQPETVPTGSDDPVLFEMALREAKTRTESSAAGWVLLDAWNDYVHGRHLLPHLRLSDQMLRCVGRVFGRRPVDEFVFGQKKGNNPKAPNGKAMRVQMPTYENVKYGRHPRQGMDVWLPKPDEKATPIVLFIHGGGWVNGDRMNADIIPRLETCLQGGVAFATVSYRLLTDGCSGGIQPPVKACLDDAVAAIRLVQTRAREWNVDPRRIGLTGGSAGACSSLYVALQDDCALGIRAVLAMRPQTSLDPTEMREWIPNIKYGHSAFGYKSFDDWLAHREDCLSWIGKFSPISLLRDCTPSKAPVFFYFAMPDPPRGELPKDPTHAGMFCTKFREVCERKGIACRSDDFEGFVRMLLVKKCEM